MDILTHTLSGIALGTVIASFSDGGFRNKFIICAFSGIASAMPDIDAISLWSRFDETIGRFFNLPHLGRDIYSSKLWYSHHGFFHSLAAAVLFATLIALTSYFIAKKATIHNIKQHFLSVKLILIAFVSAYLLHLFEDMPTPAAAWSGVNLLWPSKAYIGGTGDIWWWNNYDIFLIVLSTTGINLLFHAIHKNLKHRFKTLTISVFALGFLFATIQIKTRDFDFSYSGSTNRYQEFEQNSKAQQKDILGSRLYNKMEWFDNKLKFYF